MEGKELGTNPLWNFTALNQVSAIFFSKRQVVEVRK